MAFCYWNGKCASSILLDSFSACIDNLTYASDWHDLKSLVPRKKEEDGEKLELKIMSLLVLEQHAFLF